MCALSRYRGVSLYVGLKSEGMCTSLGSKICICCGGTGDYKFTAGEALPYGKISHWSAPFSLAAYLPLLNEAIYAYGKQLESINSWYLLMVQRSATPHCQN